MMEKMRYRYMYPSSSNRPGTYYPTPNSSSVLMKGLQTCLKAPESMLLSRAELQHSYAYMERNTLGITSVYYAGYHLRPRQARGFIRVAATKKALLAHTLRPCRPHIQIHAVLWQGFSARDRIRSFCLNERTCPDPYQPAA